MSATVLTTIAIAAGVVAGLLALALVLVLAPRAEPRRLRYSPPDTLSEPRHFTFRDTYLVQHSDNVGFLISTPVDHLKAWEELIDSLGEMADGLEPAFHDLHASGRSFQLEGSFGKDRVLIMGVRQEDDLRITVCSAEAEQTSVRVDLASLKRLEEDTALIARSSDSNPTLSWIVDGEGRVVWANAAYAICAAECLGPDAMHGWPLANLFPEQANAPAGKTRRQIVDTGGQTRWFEITGLCPDAQGFRHMHALNLDAVIAAEDNLRTFIQTLTKTFAYLPTGLAIFDRDRTLAMFNPALMDMTGLDGSWLSRRPKLEDFFDALRDHRKLPEPRDYKAWRDGLSDLSRVDACGTYQETWTLPTGETYCVTGRPQADGAVALMLEDVSADISAFQTNRIEREALIGALDASPDAIIVFAPDGQRIAANTRAAGLLSDDPDHDLPDTLDSCLGVWRDRFLPSPAWGDLRSFAQGQTAHAVDTEWSEVLHRDGAPPLTLQVVATRGGGMTLCFGQDVPQTGIGTRKETVLASTVI